MPPTDLDDLAFDPVAGLLTLAHGSSVAQFESNALDFLRWACHPLTRALLSFYYCEEPDMTTRYDEPNRTARATNVVFRWLAEAGVSIAGTRALRVRGRTTGKLRGVVVNLMTVDG